MSHDQSGHPEGGRFVFWEDLPPPQKAILLTLGSLQIALAATAWVDLARREAEQVNGRKPVWAAIIAVNFVGPLAYFLKGRRRS